MSDPAGEQPSEPALRRIPLPVRVRGPLGWARRGLRPGQALELLAGAAEQPATVKTEVLERGRVLGLIPYDKFWILSMSPAALSVALPVSATGLLDQRDPQTVTTPLLDGAGEACGSIRFHGMRTELLGPDQTPLRAIDRPDPLGLSWRLWSHGSPCAKTRRVEEREFVWEAREAAEIDPAAILVWLAGIAWCEAAAS